MEQGKKFEIKMEVNDVLNYALHQNGTPLVTEVRIKNLTGQDMENLVLRISSEENLTVPFDQVIQMIRGGEEILIRNPKVQMNGQNLAKLTERILFGIEAFVCEEEVILGSTRKEMTVLAFDEWPGSAYDPELLAAFSLPNHPVVTEILQESAQWLNKWTGNPSLDGYQSKDPNRIKKMAAAVYTSIQEKNIVYAVPPASFETLGQRVRLADAVMEQRLGTCLDMTLLYAACLEAMGLNPFMVLMRGHIFAGLWLMDRSFSETLIDDPSQLEKRMSQGINEMMVVECTAMCAGVNATFDDAVKSAGKQLANHEKYHFTLDVIRARKSGIRPLPVRIRTEKGYEFLFDDDTTWIVENPEEIGKTYTYQPVAEKEKVSKQVQWERKLLDLSLRNMLINMRLTKSVVPLLSTYVGDLEDALTAGDEFQVLSRPKEWDEDEKNGKTEKIEYTLETTNDLGAYTELIASEWKQKKIHTIYGEEELNKTLTKLYRSAKTSMEENGASTLYLALGLLRWFEDEKKGQPRYAPIVLIPIEIMRKSARKGYILRMREEEPQINITLLEFLKQNFDIHINGLNPIPMDDHGLDMKQIFAIVRHGIMEEKMWDVIESAFIGNFSFAQFVMWNDIHNCPEILENNKIVKSLISGAVEWDAVIPQEVETDEAYLPITADSSQLTAINMAANDVSFVLHGPPGTGKSQTITAMIANALTKGKKVLFVAEKMAALEVVQKRLASLGIENFCLELHSNKATKRSVLEKLKRCLEMQPEESCTEYESRIADMKRMRENLDVYVKKLHEKRASGRSLREIIDFFESVPEHELLLDFEGEAVDELTKSQLEQQKNLLEQLIAAGRAIGHPYGHPLKPITQTIYTQSLKKEYKNAVTAYKEALLALQEKGRDFANLIEAELPVTRAEWNYLGRYAEAFVESEIVPPFLLEAESLKEAFEAPYSYIKVKEHYQEKEEELQEKWNENFLQMDMAPYHKRFTEANEKFFGKRRALNALTAELQSYASFTVTTGEIPVLLSDITFHQQEKDKVEAAKKELPKIWISIIEEYETLTSLQAYETFIEEKIRILSDFADVIEEKREKGELAECIAYAKELQEAFVTVQNGETKACELLKLCFEETEDQSWLDNRTAVCDDLLENEASLKDFIVYRQFEQECKEAGLSIVCEAYGNGVAHEKLVEIYLRSIYKAIAMDIIEKEPVLNSFTGTGFQEKIAQFKNLDEEFMELTKEEMYYRLTNQLPRDNESTTFSRELNILRRAISSNGRGMSIRNLFDQIPNILQRLCPCMLMSPISAAQYLTPQNDLFDIVIFDEASQLPTCKAVGVIARGKNAVIVGDPNQMPPTSFFMGNAIDEDNLDIEDLESILDDCLALGMPQSHLKWHYRSRHESLIAFSNQEFYENSMQTFPSVNDRERRVSMVKVDGCFDRGKGRVNVEEAHAIVGEIKRRFKDPVLKEKSIGVVTFNISQQTLIEDLLLEEYRKNSEFEAWANTGEETLFVKNLENVQGDERDVILFSVAFGPDKDGKVSLNFGPINKDGGWKRLNVAVTRAKEEMIVFSTMTAEHINLKRTRARGVEAMKHFLAYAEKGRLETTYSPYKVLRKQGIMEQICKKLKEAGYEYQQTVGHSNFKVDIAVIHPDNPEEYILGILLDGDSYRQSAHTKDREVGQLNVLRGLGWNLHRVWTMDWWDNDEKEMEKLLALLQDLTKPEAEEIPEEVSETEEMPEEGTETAGQPEDAPEGGEGTETAGQPEDAPENGEVTEDIAGIKETLDEVPGTEAVTEIPEIAEDLPE